ncbi:MAG TPA: 3'-5' exonuclease [Cyclobacteriaceae bacterium]
MNEKTDSGSNGPSSITHEEIGNLPLKAYSGKVELIRNAQDLPSVMAEIRRHEVVGFDTETRPSFRKGQLYKVSLLQLAVPNYVFLIRLQHTGITPELVSFLESGDILKTGVGIRDDLHALHRLKPFVPAGFVDLVPLAREAGLKVESVKKLTGLVLGFRISKSAQTSNWEARNLTQKQIEYAATDAWVCLELYYKLTAGRNQ